jgi:hypothetical protein
VRRDTIEEEGGIAENTKVFSASAKEKEILKYLNFLLFLNAAGRRIRACQDAK